MKVLIAITACLTLGGCYHGYTMGSCARDDAHHHTANDFGGIQWCVPNGGQTQHASHFLLLD